MEVPLLSLPEVFFPQALLEGLAEKDQLIDKEKIAYMTLLITNLEESLSALKERRLTAFDALVGDYGCERRALKILNSAIDPSVAAEAAELGEVAKRVSGEMKKMYDKLPQVKKCLQFPVSPDGAVKNFFNQTMRGIRVSREMAYLLQCHLLTFTKMPIDAVREKIDISRLEKLAKGGKVQLQTEDKKRIINHVQAQLSQVSIDYLRQEARQCVGPALDVVRPIPSRHGELPIMTVSQFYSMKAVVSCLRQRGALIVVKKWCVTKEDRPLAPLFYSFGANGFLTRVSDEDVKRQSPDMPVVVFEGTVDPQLDAEQLAARLQKDDVGEVTMAEVAQGDQFEGLEEIPEACKEIRRYIDKAVEMNCVKGSKEAFLWMDHVYCSSLREVFKGGGP